MSLNRKNDSEFQFFQKYLWGFDIKLCQEGWHRPALSLFAKVSLAFSCALPKTACFQFFFFVVDTTRFLWQPIPTIYSNSTF
jgi:hypothetical protein